MGLLRRRLALSLPPLPLLLPLLLSLLLSSGCSGQTIIARGFQPFGPPDMIASGPVLETLTVQSQGECATRALYHNSLGFNLERAASPDGGRSCQPTNTETGCVSLNMEPRPGWDYYFIGRSGQAEAVTARSTGFTMSTNIADWSSYPPLLALDDPQRRWGADCNRPAAESPDKECSRYLLTGIDDGDSTFDDLDYARCFTYGMEFRMSQQLATIVPVENTTATMEQQCPPNQVVTALSDTNSYYSTVDWMKCSHLLGNWRVNYADCTFTDPSRIGGSSTAWYGVWNTGTPQDQVFGVVGIWRVGYTYTGFKQCRLYRIA